MEELKEYLDHIRQLQMEVDHEWMNLQETKEKLFSTSSAIDQEPVIVSRDPHVMEEKIACYDSMLGTYHDKAWNLIEARHELIGMIEKLNDAGEIRLLFLRYVRLMKWDDIAHEMNKSVRWCYRKNGQGLRDLRKVFYNPPAGT